MLALIRIIKFAFQDIGRNLGLSFMTILILVLMLLSVNTLIIINVLTSQAITSVKGQIDVSVFFQPDATDKNIKEITSYLNAFPEVIEITFLTKEQVLENFKNLHKNNADIMSSLDELGENPLGATLIVKTREPEDYTKIVQALSLPEYENLIETKTFADSEVAIQKIEKITKQVEKFTAGVSALFAIIAFLIIFNTIRVAIYTQRIEISIKKLVGASNWFVRGPYLIESTIFALLAIIFTSAFVGLALKLIDPYLMIVFGGQPVLTNYYLSHIILLTSAQFLGVWLLTMFSSLLAMRRHLRV
ncbi:MAG: Cell division protein [Candidatus Magasanikbacteria bacterium GW2011_GWC2_37_14]|uniref:Cell division protein FtsX n=1 Tax=Candidatus Magasanikbacteria bacterium GW2011_GWC2_37_14 TaxID=1619046 RepID=A0A0G0GA91_9BACT|nr:MAG: Cell division protein [Candidatus Magasanikbacteria bacterium GW2011_GWC2_37_14]